MDRKVLVRGLIALLFAVNISGFLYMRQASDVEKLVAQAQKLSSQGEKQKAVEQLTQALHIQRDAHSYYLRAVVYKEMQDWEKSISDYQQAIAMDPQFALAYRRLGYVYDVTGRLDEAFKNYQKAVALNPDDAIAQYDLGLAYYTRGDQDQARQHYQKAIDLDAHYSDAWHNLGIVYDNKGNKDEALRCYDQAISFNPNNFQYYDARGRTYRDLDRVEEAFKDIEHSIELNPDYFNSRMSRGYYYFLRGEFESAAQDYHKAAQLNPQDMMVWVMKAEIDRATGNYISAEKNLKRAEQADPSSPRPVYDLYRVYYALGKYHMAFAYLDQLQRMNPDMKSDQLHWKTLIDYNRGLVMEMLAYDEMALDRYNEIIKDFPDYGESYTARGRILYGKKDYQGAIADLTKGLELGTSDVDHALWYRASAFYHQQQWQPALDDIKKRSDQNDEALSEIRKEIEDYILPKFSGERKEYYEDGSLKSVIQYQGGLVNGETKIYLPNGDLMAVMQVKDSLQNGKTVYYGPDGQTVEMMFENDELVVADDEKNSPACPLSDKKTAAANGYNNEAYELFLKREHLQDGLDLVEQALEMQPDNATFLSTKAELLYAMGRYPEALESIQKALQKNSQHASFQEDLQMITEAMEPGGNHDR